MKKRTLAALYIFLLSGCTLIPDYPKLSLPVPEKWSTEETEHQKLIPETKPIKEIGWKEFFKSPQLQAILQAALDNNRDLRVATLKVEAARALYRVERADLIPEINAAARGTRQKYTQMQNSSNPLAMGGDETILSHYEANIGSTAFELDLFGRVRSDSKAALHTYFASEAARDAAQITLIAETANAYLKWLADRKILKLTQDTLSAQEKSYMLITASHKNGVASKLDLAQAQTTVETAKANQAIYLRRVEQDKNALLLLIGKHDNTLLSSEITLDDIEVLENLPAGLPSSVLLSRPDVKQAEHQLRSANANIGAARAAFFPRITLTGSYGFASNNLSDLFSNSAEGAWSFVPQATLPIFAGGRNFANLSFSKVNKQIAIARYEQSIQNAFREVIDELVARETLDDQFNAQHNLAQAHQQAYELSNARYKQGLDSFLNVLDTQRSLYSAQQAEIEVQKQQLANLVNLYKALGGGI